MLLVTCVKLCVLSVVHVRALQTHTHTHVICIFVVVVTVVCNNVYENKGGPTYEGGGALGHNMANVAKYTKSIILFFKCFS